MSAGMAWKAMHNALNISREYQEFISMQSAGPRHGEPQQPIVVPANTQMEVTRRAWQIMNRFFEYRKRNDIPLTAPDFPKLS